ALQAVEHGGGHGGPDAHRPPQVAGPDVAGADGAQVHPGGAAEDEGERHRPEQVAQGEHGSGGQGCGHGRHKDGRAPPRLSIGNFPQGGQGLRSGSPSMSRIRASYSHGSIRNESWPLSEWTVNQRTGTSASRRVSTMSSCSSG